MKESLQSKDGFRTSDLHQAAFLVARGWELEHIEMLPRGRGVFLFPKDAEAEAQEFFQDRCNVGPWKRRNACTVARGPSKGRAAKTPLDTVLAGR